MASCYTDARATGTRAPEVRFCHRPLSPDPSGLSSGDLGSEGRRVILGRGSLPVQGWAERGGVQPVHPNQQGVASPGLRAATTLPASAPAHSHLPRQAVLSHSGCYPHTLVHTGPRSRRRVSRTAPPLTLSRTLPDAHIARTNTRLVLTGSHGTRPRAHIAEGTEAVRGGEAGAGRGARGAGRGHYPGRPPRGSPSCPGGRPDYPPHGRNTPASTAGSPAPGRPRAPSPCHASSAPPPPRTARWGGA